MEVKLGCDSHDEDHTYLLYVKTFLGLGANAAREEYWRQLVYHQFPELTGASIKPVVTVPVSNTSSTTPPVVVPHPDHPTLVDPCLNPGSHESKTFEFKSQNSLSSVHVDVVGSGEFDSCMKNLEAFMDPRNEDPTTCSQVNRTCPLNDLTKTRIAFDGTEFYGFSEFFYSTDDILRLGGQYNYQKVREAIKAHCTMEWEKLQTRYDKKLFPRADQDRLKFECFKASWVMAFLHDGLRMPKAFQGFRSLYEFEGNTVQWTLGALILKTRFLPLRSLLKDSSNNIRGDAHSVPSLSSYILTHLFFLVCMTAVVVSIVVYLKHLNKITLPIRMPSSPFASRSFATEDIEPLMEVSVT